ncbi:MAG: flavodoxin family protein [Lachnospiraceae bacterium]|uniref:flavodoxin family protein n=1 Tax=Galactobacillus timonensis TaxID=2041840 RepID=UPI0023F4E3FB|nr:flavodoxin family protein [Galactobacillus timonensis]MCI6754716.1 flavodoxin family protein [Galactobacillus timonensis]MDD7087521.1 flavodoxin family protein [Galactobacillus timonensis]MDY5222399.1 flavodoxin family protein [Lachnospiraceae bacterium]
MSKILVISTSLRNHSNSESLTEKMAEGIREAGHEVEMISLKGKNLKFCIGCLVCQKTQKCVLKDDAVWIAEKVKMADTLVFSTPIYYYGMSGQMKTLLDRMNPLFPSDYHFRNVYLLTVAAENEAYTPEKAISGLQGWIDCFPKAILAGTLFCGGLTDAAEAVNNPALQEKAYRFGKAVH